MAGLFAEVVVMTGRNDKTAQLRGKTVVLVVGVHRSGTSAVTQVIHRLGVAVPNNLVPGSPSENPTGFWESRDVIATHEDFLAAIGSSWEDPTAIAPQLFRAAAAAKCRADLALVLARDIGQADLMVIKDPRLCQLIPLWKDLAEEHGVTLRVVIPVRDPREVAASLFKRNAMPLSRGLFLWFSHLMRAVQDTTGMARLFVDYERLLADPPGEARRLCAFLGLADSAVAPWAASSVAREHHHHHAEGGTPLPKVIGQACEWAKGLARGEPFDPAQVGRFLAFWDDAVLLLGGGITDSGDDAVARQWETAARLARDAATSVATSVGLHDVAGAVEKVGRNAAGLWEVSGWVLGARLVILMVDHKAQAIALVNEARDDVLADRAISIPCQPGFSLVLPARNVPPPTLSSARILAISDRFLGEVPWLPGADGNDLSEYAKRLADAEAAVLDIGRDLAERDAEIQRFLATVARLQDDRDASEARAEEILRDAEAALAAAQADKAALVQQHDRMAAETARQYEQSVAELCRQRDRLAEELAEKSQALAQGTAELEAVAGQHQAARSEIARLTSQGNALRKLAEHESASRRQLEASLGWRAVRRLAPLRRLVPAPLWSRLAGGAQRRRENEACRMVAESGLFDAAYYLAANPDVAADPVRHFVLHGGAEGRNPSPLFDCAACACQNDLPAGTNPLLWYLERRLAELRDQDLFSEEEYLARNPDVAAAGADPLWHFLTRGVHEGRGGSPGGCADSLRSVVNADMNVISVIDIVVNVARWGVDYLRPPEAFDAKWYLATYSDVRDDGANPWQHYHRYGWREGRDPNPFFDTDWYLAQYPDARDAERNPFLHYLRVGRPQGRPGMAPRPDLPTDAGVPVERMLFVLHGLGGGTEKHCRDMAMALENEEVETWALQSDHVDRLVLRRWHTGEAHSYVLARDGEWDALVNDLRRMGFRRLHLHHFIRFPSCILDLPALLGLEYDVTIHDYSWFCPRVTMIGPEGRYCGRPEGRNGDCGICIQAGGPHEAIALDPRQPFSPDDWRARYLPPLQRARRVFVPDQDVRDRIARMADLDNLVVRPHPEPVGTIPTRPTVAGDRVRIAVVGGIGPHKGFDVLLGCAEAAERDGLPILFVVIGSVCDERRAAARPNIELLGAYSQSDLPRLLAAAHCHVAAFLSVWPETYCYTLSEALSAGLYPVAFDLGAPARRIRDLGWGTLLPLQSDPASINEALLRAAVEQDLPPHGARIGTSYVSLLSDYYGDGPQP
jgi:glycosyltransferase involved in cell wall biosynthesis